MIMSNPNVLRPVMLALCCVALCCVVRGPGGLGIGFASVAHAASEEAKPFQQLLGWWIGSGRLGFKSGEIETVRCRATYRNGRNQNQLLQAVRCASPSGQIEVKSEIESVGLRLSGTWTETKYAYSGKLTGQVIQGGFLVRVSGDGVSASMTVFAKGDRHVVEIQFHDSSLIGLTMVFGRGRKKN